MEQPVDIGSVYRAKLYGSQVQVDPVDREIVRFVDRFSCDLQHNDVTPK